MFTSLDLTFVVGPTFHDICEFFLGDKGSLWSLFVWVGMVHLWGAFRKKKLSRLDLVISADKVK